MNEKYEKGSKEYIQYVVEIHLQTGLASFEVKHKTSNSMFALLNIMPRVITLLCLPFKISQKVFHA